MCIDKKSPRGYHKILKSAFKGVQSKEKGRKRRCALKRYEGKKKVHMHNKIVCLEDASNHE